MTIAIMGCGSSIYDDPELVRKQTASQSIIKTSTSGKPEHSHNTQRGDNSYSNITLTSKLKRGKVAPIIATDKNSAPNGGHFGTSNDSNNHSNTNCNNLTNHRAYSPAFSDWTDRTNRSIKRVAFTDQPAVNLEHQDKMMNGVEGDVRTITGSPTDRKRAKRKRERALRKRLLDKMGEAESISERLLLESERLSLTSSMSRATSRTCSPLHTRAYNYEKNTDDNGTEVSSVAPDTPRGAPPPPGEAPPIPVEAPPTQPEAPPSLGKSKLVARENPQCLSEGKDQPDQGNSPGLATAEAAT